MEAQEDMHFARLLGCGLQLVVFIQFLPFYLVDNYLIAFYKIYYVNIELSVTRRITINFNHLRFVMVIHRFIHRKFCIWAADAYLTVIAPNQHQDGLFVRALA